MNGVNWVNEVNMLNGVNWMNLVGSVSCVNMMKRVNEFVDSGELGEPDK